MENKKYILIFFVFYGIQLFAQNNNSFTYIYDDLNRLIEVQYGNGTTIQYEYDKVGNRTLRLINGVNALQPDIAPTNGSLSLNTVGVGAEVTVIYNNENIGTGSSGGFNTLIVLSDNTTYEAGTDEILATVYTSNLTAGAMPQLMEEVMIPTTAMAGSKNILVVADFDDEVNNELSETNNLLVLPITIEDCSGLSVAVLKSDELCDGNNGSATATGTGGTAPYSFAWSTIPAQSGSLASSLSAGNYAVTIMDETGCEAETSFTVSNIGDDPVANFSHSVVSMEVSFVNTSAFGSTYSWDFGDGNSSTAEHPMHTYAGTGNYTVCLDVTNTCATDQYCAVIVVNGGNCNAPVGLSASSITETSAVLGWNNVSNAVSYTLRYMETGGGSWGSPINTTNASYALSGLTAGTSYEYQVKTVCSGGMSSGYSSSVYFSTTGGGGSGGSDLNVVFEDAQNDMFSDDIVLTTDGGYAVTGSNNGRVFVAKYDNTGNKEWAKVYTGSYLYYHGERIVQTVDGGYAVVGELKLNSSGDYMIYLLKITSTGAFDWMKTYQGGSNNYGNSLVQASNGDYVIVGYTYSYGHSDGELLILKLDDDGDFIWGKTIGTSNSFGIGVDIIESIDGKYIVLGKNRSVNTTDDATLFKISGNGTVEWSKYYHSTDNNRYNPGRISQAADGSIYLVGAFGQSQRNGSIIKTNSSGGVLWNKNLSGAFDDDRLFDVEISSNGNVIAVGESNNSGSSHEDNVFYKLNAAGTVLSAMYNYDDDDQYIKGAVLNGSKIAVTGRSESTFGTNNYFDKGFIIEKDVNFMASCSTNMFTPTVGAESLTDGNVPESGSVTPTVQTRTMTATTLSYNELYPCGGGCNTTAGIAPLASTTVCQNESISLFSTSTGATTFSWKVGSNGTPFSSNSNTNYTFTSAGIYKIYLDVTDGGGCADQDSVTITVDPLPIIYVNTLDEQCGGSDGSATVDVSAVANPQILWSTGATVASINFLSAGNYSVQVTDQNGCLTNQNANIANTSNGFSVIGQIEDISCFGANDGSIDVTANGTVGTTSYTWSNGSNANPLENLPAGQYTVTVSDAAGCNEVANYTVEEPDEINVDFQIFHESEVGATDATATALPTGGTLPYSYAWGNGETTATTLSLAEGIHTISITDANNCTASADASIFVKIESAVGVELFKKDFTGGNPDYVQVIDLEAGAYIEFDAGDVTSGGGTGNPHFDREDINDVWADKTFQHNNVFSMTNGQFFNAGQSPSAQMAFPVKESNAMVSEGYGNTSEFLGEKLFMPVWTNNADVTSYNDDPNSIIASSAPQGIVGLHREADKAPSNNTGRTFAGVLDKNGDGVYEKVLIFTSKTVTQAHAAERLHDFGVEFDKILMLDGGGSAQMICNGTDYVSSSRLIPQSIVVYSGGVQGCTDVNAHNYNPAATINDGSCETCTDNIQNADETGVDCGGALCAPCSNPCPDLIVENLEILSNGKISADITNQGSATAIIEGSIVLQAYKSADQIPGNSNDPGAGGWLLDVLVDSLQPNQSFHWEWGNVTGTDVCLYPYLVVIVDRDNNLSECDDGNNVESVLIDPTTVCGCTDQAAHNYNSNATQDDGSCETCGDGVQNGDETGIDCGGVLCPSCPVPYTLSLSRNEITPPDTIVLTYNITTLGSSNILNFGDGSQMTITQSSGAVTHSYQHEGVFRPRIIIDGSEVVTESLLAKSCDWISYVTSTGGYREANEDYCQVLNNGIGHVDPNMTPKSYYWTTFANYKDFFKIGDAVSLEVRVKNPQSDGGISCYDTEIAVLGEHGNAWGSYMTTGCSQYASIGAADTSVSGSTTNLSAITGDLSEWRTIRLEVKNDTVKTYFDGDLRYTLPYTGEVGNVLGLKVSFKGSGSIDWLKLYDDNDLLVVEEEFVECECDECKEDWVVSQPIITAGEYLASNSITSTGKIVGGKVVTFDATNSILLSPNFEVEQGAVFDALTGVGCTPTWACGDVLHHEGQDYNTVQIGNQCWMSDNLNVGTMVNGNTNQTDNSIIEKYCYLDNPTNCDTYGGLYQWDEMMQYTTVEGTQGVCPTGWHLPTHAEWTTLVDHLGGSSVAGGKLKETGTLHWDTPNTNATNSSGFTGLPGGYRNYYFQDFFSLKNTGYFWSSSEQSSSDGRVRYIFHNQEQVSNGYNKKITGYSIRCVKD